MKKLFVIFICLQAFVFAKDRPSPVGNVVLISHTRSGRHWYEYSIRELTGKTVHWLAVKRNYLSDQKKFWCTHSPKFDYLLSKQYNKIVLTLRNYKEIIFRHTRGLEGEEKLAAALDPNRFKGYLAYVRYFDKWNPAMRHLYYYEDMMADPETTFQRLLTFMRESAHRLSMFISNIEHHRKTSIQRTPAKSISYGAPIYHTKDVPKEILIKMDEMMKEEAGPLYDRYLKRYEETSL